MRAICHLAYIGQPGRSLVSDSGSVRDAGSCLRVCALLFLALQKAGCETIYLNGSFVTSKDNPADYDGCWDIDSVSLELLDPVLMNFSSKQAGQKKKYGGELFPNLPDDTPAFLDLFQTDKSSGEAKGIVAIDLRTFE
jgi:hypothetical protein